MLAWCSETILITNNMFGPDKGIIIKASTLITIIIPD